MRHLAAAAALLASASVASTLLAQSKPGVISGPVGPSPYDVVRGWHKPFADAGFAFGGNSGVFAESPDRILVAQRGEYRLPTPVPPEFSGFAGSIGVNVLSATAGRVWKNCLYVLDANGNAKERWTQWDTLCEGSSGPGPHRLRISPYDPEHRVWVINETFHTIYVFSNDGKKLLKTYGEKNVHKVAILMTDGIYNTVGGLSDGDNGATAVQSARFAGDTCSAMKAKGITVYTVGFEAPTNAKNTLRNCASDPSKFYDATDGDKLRASFRAIASEINNLRLAK